MCVICFSSGNVALHDLSSVELIKTDAKSIHTAIVDVKGYGIPWKNLMPVLLDSCNVMRGTKSGKLIGSEALSGFKQAIKNKKGFVSFTYGTNQNI